MNLGSERLFSLLAFCICLNLTGCQNVNPDNKTLSEARSGHTTQLAKNISDRDSLGMPSSNQFSLVKFPSDVGDLEAWISKPADPSVKSPAMIWITGGFPPGGIGESAWESAPASNDQSAKAYREQGFVMMYPTLRGCFGNPGKQEGFYGEVDDVISAGRYMKTLSHIDPDRIYLGGHSTGGTLVLLVAESTDLFAGVVSFGPVDDPYYYGPETVVHKNVSKEQQLRAPVHYLTGITSPTLVIEGVDGNIDSLRVLERKNGGANRMLTFVAAKGRGHFDVLAPANRSIAAKLLNHKRGEPIVFTSEEIK